MCRLDGEEADSCLDDYSELVEYIVAWLNFMGVTFSEELCDKRDDYWKSDQAYRLTRKSVVIEANLVAIAGTVSLGGTPALIGGV